MKKFRKQKRRVMPQLKPTQLGNRANTRINVQCDLNASSRLVTAAVVSISVARLF